jgi:hypothetical protein
VSASLLDEMLTAWAYTRDGSDRRSQEPPESALDSTPDKLPRTRATSSFTSSIRLADVGRAVTADG